MTINIKMNNIQNKKDFYRKLLLSRRQKYAISEHIEAEVLKNVQRVLEGLERCHTGVGRYPAIKATGFFRNFQLALKWSFLDSRLRGNDIIGLYQPLNGEIDIMKIAPLLPNIALPKIRGTDMVFVKYAAGEPLEKAGFTNLMQPQSTLEVLPKIVIVPGLAFSTKGYRLGFGKGYYDRYFAKNKTKNMISIGICRHEDLQEYLPHAEHDYKFDYIITDIMILKI